MNSVVCILVLLIACVFSSTSYYSKGACPAQVEVDCEFTGGSQNFECVFGDFHLSVTGVDSKYTIWNNNDNSTQYKFQLNTCYEATWKSNDTLQKEGGTNIGLNSLDWVNSGVVVNLENITVCLQSNASGDCVSSEIYCL